MTKRLRLSPLPAPPSLYLWERERAKGATRSYADTIDQKLAELLRHPSFLDIRAIVGWYIANTVLDPAATAGRLWTVTAMPSTNRTKTEHRLLTLSCGNLETLFIVASTSEDYENDPDAFVAVNINTTLFEDPRKVRDRTGLQWEDADGLHSTGRWVVFEAQYRGEKVSSVQCGLETLAQIIDGDIDFPNLDEFIAKAYELNTRLMRRGSTMYTRFHNQKLADLLLAEAATWDA